MIALLTDQIRRPLLCVAVLLLGCASLAAQGVQTRGGATAIYGNAAICSQPATIDFDSVKKKTPEWKTIVSDNIPESSGRYQLLMTQMNNRIRRACETVAQSEGRDCVLRQGDIAEDNGLEVVDLTAKIKAEVQR